MLNWWDGKVQNPVVYVEDGMESWVLDANGNPFVVTKRYKMGFDLTPKDKQQPTYTVTHRVRPFTLIL